MSAYCGTCAEMFNSLGIARHRAMHRDRREDCVITYTAGHTVLHAYSQRAQTVSKTEIVDKEAALKGD